MLTRPGLDLAGPPLLLDAGRIAAALAVAELSYRFVELPVRRGALGRWGAALRSGARYSPAAGLAGAALLVATLTLSCGPQVVMPRAAPPLPASPPLSLPASPPPAAPIAPAASPAVPTPGGPAEAALVVGDSVVLGSADALRSALGPGTTVDGTVGRQFDRGPAIVASWAAAHPGPVVVHLGSNGIIRDSDAERLVAATRGRILVLVNVAVPRRWQQPDNDELARVASRHPGQVVLVDWAAAVTADPGLLGPDHVHPNERGRAALADAVRRALDR